MNRIETQVSNHRLAIRDYVLLTVSLSVEERVRLNTWGIVEPFTVFVEEETNRTLKK